MRFTFLCFMLRVIFFLQFSTSIILLTLFLPFKIYLHYQCLFFTIFLALWLQKWKRKALLNTFIVNIIALLLAISVVTIRFNKNNNTLQKSQSVISWTIVSWIRNKGYLLNTNNWNYFLREPKNTASYGDSVLIQGYASEVETSQLLALFPSSKLFSYGEFNYDLWRWTKGIAGDISSPTIIHDPFLFSQKKFTQSLLVNKHSFVTGIREIYGDTHWSLVSGMLLWDISPMTKIEYEWFLWSSLVHLVAVSGWNLIFIATLLTIFLFFLPFYVRIVVVFLLVVGYCWLVGFESSVFRAMIMFGLVYGARGLWRISGIRRSMMYAWIFLLCMNPYMLLYDLWFILSFWALGWILLTSKIIKKSKTPFQKVVKNYVLPSVWASLGTYPILLYFTWSINLLGIIGNIIVVPFVPLIMTTSLISLTIETTWLWEVSIRIVRFLVDGLIFISQVTNVWWIIIGGDKKFTLFFLIFLLVSYLFIYQFFLRERK